MKRKLFESYGEIGTSEDLVAEKKFWKDIETFDKFKAAWEIITDYYKSIGKSYELRFSRSTETAGEIPSQIRSNRRIRRNGVLRTKSH